MEEEQAKVHSHRKHRRNNSSRVNVTEPTSPLQTTTITKPTVIVQSNDDEIVNSPASSISVNSKPLQASGIDDDNLNLSKDDLNENAENLAQTQELAVEDKAMLFKKLPNATTSSKYSPRISTPNPKLPVKSLSDPTASPAQRSIRSRSSNEKSPRQKRSKSESRRRRERKLIAAGEMEVRQANETLMRYLKQCSEVNDGSLSGELEIDKSIDDRFHRKSTKLQRDRQYSSNSSLGANGKLIKYS